MHRHPQRVTILAGDSDRPESAKWCAMNAVSYVSKERTIGFPPDFGYVFALELGWQTEGTAGMAITCCELLSRRNRIRGLGGRVGIGAGGQAGHKRVMDRRR